ncbi:MAG: site-specific DNA-methyltransferase [Leptospiraceae bacterium]|nr:site-specific DNA-methyltransferase [Leptospiraceae bacterium]
MPPKKDPTLNLKTDIPSVEEYEFEPIKGYPMLHWKGKRPFYSTQFYPAQLKEQFGEEVDGWMNQIYWGDNLQVMSHLLKKYRGKVDLIYIDPPFDSKADYKKKIQLKGKQVTNDSTAFEEKQYTDIWSNDEYLQFMYERLILMRELLSDTGSIFFHCDYHKVHYLKCILDEIFGVQNFVNDIKWVRSTNPKGSQYVSYKFDPFTDNILLYSKTNNYLLNIDLIRRKLSDKEILEKYHRRDEKGIYYDGPIISSSGMGDRPNLVYEYKGYTPPRSGWRVNLQKLIKIDEEGNLGWSKNNVPFRKLRPEDDKGHSIGDFWNDISLINSQADERLGYPTQKPEELLERIIKLSSNPGDLVFDCFMGSGTTQAVAMKLGRRFIGADINLGAIQTTTKRLLGVASDLGNSSNDVETRLIASLPETENPSKFYTGFQVYNVNHYDVFRNPIEAKDILLRALEIQPLPGNNLYDGDKDGKKVKIMPINRIATRVDLNELVTGFNYKEFEKLNTANPGKPVESIQLICMGHEPDLGAYLKEQVKNSGFTLDVEVVDILRDKANLEFKRDSEAEITIENNKVLIRQFYPMNLLQKLSIMKENVENWKELVESVMIDFNYDGAVFEPQVVDVPEGDELVKGVYPVPANKGTIRVKITDLLSESLEVTI